MSDRSRVANVPVKPLQPLGKTYEDRIVCANDFRRLAQQFASKIASAQAEAEKFFDAIEHGFPFSELEYQLPAGGARRLGVRTEQDFAMLLRDKSQTRHLYVRQCAMWYSGGKSAVAAAKLVAQAAAGGILGISLPALQHLEQELHHFASIGRGEHEDWWKLWLDKIIPLMQRAYSDRFGLDHTNVFEPIYASGTVCNILAETVKAAADDAQHPAAYRWRTDGNMWEICFDDEHGHFEDMKGFRVLHCLLQFPNPIVPFEAVFLMGGSTDIAIAAGGKAQILDSKAISALRERRSELVGEIEKANNEENGELAARLEQEQETVIKELLLASRPGGRSGSLGSKGARESARTSIRAAITRVTTVLLKSEPPRRPLPKLAKHLDESIQAEGYAFVYRPKARLEWELR